MRYFVFRQHGNGGSPIRNANMAEYVIVRAANAAAANTVAERVGVYFRDIPWPSEENAWQDCDTCNDRWEELPDSCQGHATLDKAWKSLRGMYRSRMRYFIVVYEESPPRKVYYVSEDFGATPNVCTSMDGDDRAGKAFYDQYACYWDDALYMSQAERDRQYAAAQQEIAESEEMLSDIVEEGDDFYNAREAAVDREEAARWRRRADVWIAKLSAYV